MRHLSSKQKRKARERAVQFLFGLDFTKYDWGEAIGDFWENNASEPGVKEYAEHLISGTVERREAIDSAIATAAEGWTPDRIGRIEFNAMRVAAFELMFEPSVPQPVAINEAIEVVKRFSAPESASFINAVLDRIRRT